MLQTHREVAQDFSIHSQNMFVKAPVLRCFFTGRMLVEKDFENIPISPESDLSQSNVTLHEFPELTKFGQRLFGGSVYRTLTNFSIVTNPEAIAERRSVAAMLQQIARFNEDVKTGKREVSIFDSSGQVPRY